MTAAIDDEPGEPDTWLVPGYRHERQLGSGASGRVVLAWHEATGTPVAIKYLVRTLHSAADFRDAYRSEAVLLGELQSEHVARLYEYVEGPHGAAIVMELVEGLSLRALLRAEGATSPEAALVVLKGSLLGLAAAHEAGVVHRDYKPENVLVTPQGVSKLVDFGIAARSGDIGAAAGTPLYMAPEQFAGQPATPAADVYAATATFFECITGERPYAGTTVMELMIQHSQAPIPDELAPEHVRPLIRAGLAKTPQERPESAAAFVDELETVAAAAYGEDWEERGQHKLVALLAMLPLLLLESPPEVSSGTTALATTNLGPAAVGGVPRMRRIGSRTTRAIVGVAAGCLLIGGVAAITSASGANSSSATTSGATTSVGPSPGAGGGAGPSASGTASATASSSSSATSSSSPSVAAGKASSSPSPSSHSTATSTTTATASSPASSSPSASAVLHVRSVAIKSLGCSGRAGAQATVTVTSDGAAPGELDLDWFYTDANGKQTNEPTVAVTLKAGETNVTGTYYHSFGVGAYWGLMVSTKPAAASGNYSFKAILAAQCGIQ